MKSLGISSFEINGLKINNFKKNSLEKIDLLLYYNKGLQCYASNFQDLFIYLSIKSSIFFIILYILFIMEIFLQFFF